MICALEHIPLEHLFSSFCFISSHFWFFFILLFRHVNLWRITPHTHTHFAIRQASLYSFPDNLLPYLDILDMSRNGCFLALKLFGDTDTLGLICLGVYNATWSGID